jgi:DNA recombination protein RmuC
MNTGTIVLLIIAAIGLGALISWLVTRMIWSVKLAAVRSELINAQGLLAEQKAFMEKADRAMRETFGSLAAHALHQNNQAFVSLAESRLGEKVTQATGALEVKEKAIEGLVKPLAESLGKMETKINELENKRENAYSNISTILEGMQRTAQALDKGTQGLISALKNSSTRGKYGEIGLRRVVEFSGMTEHCDFIEQVYVSGDEGIFRPDMVINLPDRKTIVVDAKTPLDAYMKVFETDNEAEQRMLLLQHAKAVRDHLKKLKEKAYWNQFPESPDYVVLYMQIESSFGAALQADPELIEEGIRNHVIFATPTTLIMLLKTVGFVWQQRSIAENIEEIRDAGIELYNRTTVLLKHFSNIGIGLKNSVSHFNNAVASLESRFIPQARKLFTLGSAYTKNAVPDIEQVEMAVRQLDIPADEENSLFPGE